MNEQSARPGKVPANFTVEFGDEKNRSFLLRTVRREVRGSFSLRKFYSNEGGGRAVGNAMTRVPDIPGEFLCIKASEGVAIFYDPWEDKPEDWTRLNNALSEALPARTKQGFGPVPRQESKMSVDEMKTLVLEIFQMVEDKQARVVKGRMPDREAIDAMPGHELYDPMNSNARKPRYVEEVPEWERRIEMGH